MKHWECRDCGLGEKHPCTCSWEGDEFPPTICPMGNDTDCEWELLVAPASASANTGMAQGAIAQIALEMEVALGPPGDRGLRECVADWLERLRHA